MCLRFLAERRGKFCRLVAPAQVDGLAKAVGELDARRTTRDVRFDVLTGFWRKFQVQVVGEQGKDFFAFLIVLVLFHVFPFLLRFRYHVSTGLFLCESPGGLDAIWF